MRRNHLSVPSVSLLLLTQFTLVSPAVGATGEAVDKQKSTSNSLEEVVVTAQRREQSLQKVPISITVYKGEDLAQLKIERVSDLKLVEPSLSERTGFSSNQVNFGMRGFSSLLVGGLGIQPAVSVVIDGVALAMNSEFAAELADVERVEVLKGPQGTLFGANAVGGLINMVRTRPADDFETMLEFQLSDDDEHLAKGMVNVPFTDKLAGRAFAYYKHRDGHLKNLYPGGEDAGGETSYGAVAKLRFNATDRFSITATADYRDSEHYIAMVTTIPDIPERAEAVGGEHVYADKFLINQNEDSLGTFVNYGLGIEAVYEISDSIVATLISARRELQNASLIDLDASPARATDPMGLLLAAIPRTNRNRNPGENGSTSAIDTDYWTHELRFQFTYDSFDWTVGGYYRDFFQSVDNEIAILAKDSFLVDQAVGLPLPAALPTPTANSYLALSVIGDSEMRREEMALFTDLTWHINDQFDVFAGVRHHTVTVDGLLDASTAITPAEEPFFTADNHSSTFNIILVNEGLSYDDSRTSDEWAARVGASWFPSQTVNLYTSASRGFIGTGVDMSPGADPTAPFLNPTTSVSAEIGIKSRWLDNRLMVNAAIFHQKSENLQIAVTPPGELQTRARNAGALTSKGVELSVAFRAMEHLYLSGSMTAVDTARGGLIERCYYEQTEAEGCTIDRDGNGFNDHQDATGNPSVGTPELAYNMSMRYDYPMLDHDMIASATMSWSWRDDVQFQLDGDPLAVQEAYGLLDMVVALNDTNERFEYSLYIKNILDQYFAGDRFQAIGAGGRISVDSPRESRTYYGLRAKYRF